MATDRQRTPRDSGRMPPQDYEAERSVLGAVLLSPDAMGAAVEVLRDPPEELFYFPEHAEVFGAMRALYQQGAPLDIVSVIGYLRKADTLERAGGVEYVSELTDAVPTSANIEYYANTVLDAAILRQLIKACATISTEATSGGKAAQELLDEAESSVFTLAHKRQLQDVHPLGDLVPPAVERIEDLIRNQKGETGLRTGYQDLDEITSGLQPSDMVILAARPSVGKTAFALNIAANAAVQYRKGVLLFSLEMSKEQLVHRLLCMVGRINSKRLRTGFLADAEFPKLTEAAGKLAPAPIFIDDAADLSILDLRSKARRIRAKHALDLIIIDYLQLMRPSDPRLPRYEQIGEISRGIKGIARELNAPVLALSQLSREAEKDDSGMPRLSHLRESGSIEQDADVVLMLSRPPAHNRDGDGGDAPIDENLINLFVAKQRNGPTGQVQLVFDREHQQFHDIVRGGAGAPPQAPPPDAPSTFDAGAILNEPFDDYEAEETGDEDDEIPF